MGNINKAVDYMIWMANDNSHGYDQVHRDGNKDFDCSSLVSSALNHAGYNVKKGSTTKNLKEQLMSCGAEELLLDGERKRGDIFLKVGRHVVVCTDSKNIVHASINEKGTAVGGKTGDQTGKEICVRSFYKYNGGWDYHFRLPSEEVVSVKSAHVSEPYIVGKKYTIVVDDLRVRAGAGVSYAVKQRKDLTSDGQKHADSQGRLQKGTVVQCLEIRTANGDYWIRIPSGWIAAKYKGTVYVN